MITIRSFDELVKLEEASRVVLETLDAVEKAVAPGLTTEELDRIAEAEIRRRGARCRRLPKRLSSVTCR